ncbi:DUF4312 family protein [Enterococcus faecium]|uniref:DUF4312 family protein n=1 Tax=Enterococcus faecium TaxID=1352 RepID=UPI00280CBE48|nr:DUF4312 family protein [Enterococcus faecium]MDQ8216523.1 DUF4312 family protein [Enterococcus faecium]MEB7866791.1 DUF4312 family protein [Enterococcus faecium]
MSVQKTIQQKVTVSGKGETKQHAFASALAEIQNKIMEQSNVLLRIEPVNVDILKAVENKYTERFLFFFFPRQRISYEVELSVTVAVTEIKLADISFSQQMIEDPNGIAIPFVTKKI